MWHKNEQISVIELISQYLGWQNEVNSGKKCGQNNYHYRNKMSNIGFGWKNTIQVCYVLV